jgi:hypothetical protein
VKRRRISKRAKDRELREVLEFIDKVNRERKLHKAQYLFGARRLMA